MVSDWEDDLPRPTKFVIVSKFHSHMTAVSTCPVFVRKDQQNDELCDVTLYGISSTWMPGIKGHEMILSLASAHFREAFTSQGFMDSGAKKYHMSQIDHATLEVIVSFIYTNTLQIDGKNDLIERLKFALIGADYLLMPDLREVCGECLKDAEFLTIDRAVSMWLFARKYHCPLLEDAAIRKIRTNLAAVAAHTDYLNMDGENVLALMKAVVFGKLFVDSNRVCEMAIAWLGFEQAERKKHCDGIMRHVKLRDLPMKLLQRVSDASFLSEQVLWAVNEALAMRTKLDKRYKLQKVTDLPRSAVPFCDGCNGYSP